MRVWVLVVLEVRCLLELVCLGRACALERYTSDSYHRSPFSQRHALRQSQGFDGGALSGYAGCNSGDIPRPWFEPGPFGKASESEFPCCVMLLGWTHGLTSRYAHFEVPV